MTPKCSICFIFGLFDLLFVCLRPTTLRVVTSQYLHLHHLQSYVQSNLGEAWTSSRYGEPYGKCAVLKMTSNDPKMIYLLYFWTFWLLFVCLRPTTLCVVTSTILTLTPFAILRSIQSRRSLDKFSLRRTIWKVCGT